MGGQTDEVPKQPARISATLFLERQIPIDYNVLIERVGGVLGISATIGDDPRPDAPIVLPADGDLIIGMQMDFPYPVSLQGPAQFAYWWPNALSDLTRHKAHLMVSCPWSKHSRMDAHMRHLVLMRELVEQLPVVGVLWGSSLVQTDIFKGEFANATLNGEFPFSLWILIQFSRQPNGNILISTLGMRDFERMEIETESSLPLDQTVDLIRKFGSYLVTSGAVVRDGDTFGLSETQKIRVRHTRSFRPDVNDPVYWIELTEQPTVRKPQGYFSNVFGSTGKQ